MSLGEPRVLGPEKIPSEAYFHTRWQTLRKPLGLPLGTERLPDDQQAIHAWVEGAGEIVAVGRAHLIPPESAGAMQDHSGASASMCPSFTPLEGEEGFPQPMELRPAFHIRQMGTLVEWRRQGLAAQILQALEEACVDIWKCNSGWLQARVGAIPFYESQGWTVFGEEYQIEGVGPHYSMWKDLGVNG